MKKGGALEPPPFFWGLFPIITEAEGLADLDLEGFGLIQQRDFYPQEQNGDVARGEGWKTNGVLLRRNESQSPSSPGTREGVLHLRSVEPVVVGKGALINNLGAQFDQSLKKAFGNGDAGDCSDVGHADRTGAASLR